jgi:hypothetical protein
MKQFAAIRMPQGSNMTVMVRGYDFKEGVWMPDDHDEQFKHLGHAITTYTQVHKLIYIPRQPDDNPDILGVFI